MITEILAQNPTGPEFGKASPIGLVIVLLLLVGLVLLIRSMNKQLRKLPDTFEPDHPERDQAADEGTDRGAAAGGTDRGAAAGGTDRGAAAGGTDRGAADHVSDRDDAGGSKSGREQRPNGNDTAGHGTDR